MKKNKKLFLSIIVIASISLIGISGVIAADKYSSLKTKEGKPLNNEQINKVKEQDIKIQSREEAIWSDIKESFKINEDEYTKLDLNSILNGNSKELEDKAVISQVFKCMEEAPVGSFKPFVLMKKGNNEIIVAYKVKEGKNVLNTIKKAEFDKTATSIQGVQDINDFEWRRSSQSTDGKPIEEIKSLDNKDYK